MKFFKRLFCKHEYKTLTNLYGDAINTFHGARSIKECIHCGKWKYSGLDPDCKKVNEIF